MTEQKTVGELFDKRGPCELMVKVLALAKTRNRLPVGEWDYRFTSDPRFRMIVNGGERAEWYPPDAFAPVRRFECHIEHDGWLVASFNTVGGVAFGLSEAEIIAAIDREIAAL